MGYCDDLKTTEATKGGLWYFAHPYTRKDADGKYVHEAEVANFHLANMRAGELIRRGINIYSPISHTHPIHAACPAMIAAREHELWYQLDNEVIDTIGERWKGIILAPEWETSTGCRNERERIEAFGGEAMLYEYMLSLYPLIRT